MARPLHLGQQADFGEPSTGSDPDLPANRRKDRAHSTEPLALPNVKDRTGRLTTQQAERRAYPETASRSGKPEPKGISPASYSVRELEHLVRGFDLRAGATTSRQAGTPRCPERPRAWQARRGAPLARRTPPGSSRRSASRPSGLARSPARVIQQAGSRSQGPLAPRPFTRCVEVSSGEVRLLTSASRREGPPWSSMISWSTNRLPASRRRVRAPDVWSSLLSSQTASLHSGKPE